MDRLGDVLCMVVTLLLAVELTDALCENGQQTCVSHVIVKDPDEREWMHVDHRCPSWLLRTFFADG